MAPVFCNDCSVKIGLFKKKFTCQLCLNRFCDKCFSKVKENAHELSTRSDMSGRNCLSCIVLQCGSIKREHLFLLRNKQLAEYLGERNISTENCSEKYHLVDLIMEFAETHGIKSGDDLESDVVHRDHVAELRRKAEMLRVQEHVEEDPGDEEQPHYSGVRLDDTSDNSQDPSDTETNDETVNENIRTETTATDEIPNLDENRQDEDAQESQQEFHESDGDTAHLSPRHQASGRWYSVEDIQAESDITSLSVLELKQILAANFIDYRGCCEKQELVNKVTRLYQSQQTEQSKGEETDRDLCKICMDRIIDCVFLDCAHLVACTKCGKQLSECPICRAFIVRVVHIFRA